MAMAWIWTGMVTVSLVFAAVNGTMDAVSAAALEGAGAAVELCIAMAGVLCLWSGVMELMSRCGLSRKLAAALRPALGRLLPRLLLPGSDSLLSGNLHPAVPVL